MSRTTIAAILAICCTASARSDDQAWLDAYNVVWTSPSKNSGESMPCAGGDIGLNVWVENGALLFYIGRAGCRDENGALLKPGRCRIQLSPNPLEKGSFHQELKLRHGCVYIDAEQPGGAAVAIKVWVEVSRPIVHVDIESDEPITAEATYESWRTETIELPNDGSKHDRRAMCMINYDAYPGKVFLYKDEIRADNKLIRFHHRVDNGEDCFNFQVKQQELEPVRHKMVNPLENLAWGGAMVGDTVVDAEALTIKGGFGQAINGDVYRWKSKGVLSVMVQESPKEAHEPTALRVIDFTLGTSIASAAETTYRDGRPAATLRMNAKDHGIVLRHGDGPDKCDILGARDVWVFQSDGTYYMHYDAAGPRGWLCSLAVSNDLVTWEKRGPILDFGKPGEDDSKSASYGVTYYNGKQWHMFYLGTPNVSGPPNLVPSFPYLTMKARGNSAAGPWIKQKDVVPFRTEAGTYYSITASPGQTIKSGDEFLQFFSATTRKAGNPCVQRTLGIARTEDLDGPWTVDPRPMVPIEEQIENSSLYYEKSIKTWFLFTNHIGIDEGEYTDAIWVYWSKDPNQWDPKNKAVVLDGQNCAWSKKCIGLPSVVPVGKRLALFYDSPGGNSTSHMKRHIGLAWLDLPLSPPTGNAKAP